MTSPAMVFDCDGVLLDSNGMKVQAFRHVLSAFPDDEVERFMAFQRTAFGLSRYRLIDRFFADFSTRPAAEGEIAALLASFGAYCTDNYPHQPLTVGAREVLARLESLEIPMYVVSGSDQEELRATLATIGIAARFRSILGSPETKSGNLDKVKAEQPGRPIVFVGDAEADWQAASTHGCEFYYLSTWAADQDGMARLKERHGFPEIAALPELLDRLPLALP